MQAALERCPRSPRSSTSARERRLTALPRAGASVLAAVQALAARSGAELGELQLESGRLDEVFRAITA